jgi:ribosome-associated toxin RatA of RatAB toxin-antitoxin module
MKLNSTFAGFALVMLCSMITPSAPLVAAAAKSDSLQDDTAKLMRGEVIVTLTDLEEGVLGVTGKVFITATPSEVWAVLTDYNHHKDFMPNILDSGILSEQGDETVFFYKGRSGVLFFRKTVNVQLKVKGECPHRLYFQQVTGDFKVYQGEWTLYPFGGKKGTVLSYKAQIKPDFFAPGFFVRDVQKHDMPLMMGAIKKRVESATLSVSP